MVILGDYIRRVILLKKLDLNEFYYLRFLACLSVVAVHAISWSLPVYPAPNLLNDALKILKMILMFATPVFVFMSEFLISYSYTKSVPNNFLKKRFKYIFIPFLSMAFIYGLATYIFNDISAREIVSTILANIFFGNFLGYFVLIIFQFYIFHLLFSRFLENIKARYMLTLSFIINFSYLVFFNFTSPLDIPFSNYIWERYYWIPFLGWIFYFSLGYYIGRNYEIIKIKLYKYKYAIFIMTIISAAVVLLSSYIGVFPDLSSKRIDVLIYSSFMILSLLIIFSRIKKVSRIVQVISAYSFSIYLLHPLILDLITSLAIAMNITNVVGNILLFSLLLFLIALLISIFVTFLVNKLNYGYMIVGSINKKKKTRKSLETNVS